MDILDNAKEAVEGLKDKATGLVSEHEAQIESGIDKAAEFIDDKTGNKHSEKIDGAAQQAKDLLSKLGGDSK
ncbi:MAG: antitoxin [Acidimicrobiia bacterium]